MRTRQVNEVGKKMGWGHYVLIGIGILLTVLLAVAVVYFREEVEHAGVYGYAGGFAVSILGGITIIPVPSLLVVFTLGHALNPVYVGLVSGLGEALGGITVYLTGAGGETLWSRLSSRQRTFYDKPSSVDTTLDSTQSKLWSKGQAFYNRLSSSLGRWGASWLVFFVSAFVWGLYYFVGLAAGALRMGLVKFFLISWAGKTVRGIIVAYAGYWGLYFLLRGIGA